MKLGETNGDEAPKERTGGGRWEFGGGSDGGGGVEADFPERDLVKAEGQQRQPTCVPESYGFRTNLGAHPCIPGSSGLHLSLLR